MTTTCAPTTPAYTPAHHITVSKLMPIKLLSLGTGDHGKTAIFEFEGGFQRELVVNTPADARHPIFKGLNYTESNQLWDHSEIKTRQPDGTVKVQRSPLSFVTTTRTKRGAHISSNSFDVPPEEYGAGNVTGYRAALDLMRVMKSGGGYPPFLQCIQDATLAFNEPSSSIGRSGAAVGFLRTIEECFAWAIHNTNFEPHMQEKIDRKAAINAQLEVLEKDREAKRIKRAARKAAKAEVAA